MIRSVVSTMRGQRQPQQVASALMPLTVAVLLLIPCVAVLRCDGARDTRSTTATTATTTTTTTTTTTKSNTSSKSTMWFAQVGDNGDAVTESTSDSKPVAQHHRMTATADVPHGIVETGASRLASRGFNLPGFLDSSSNSTRVAILANPTSLLPGYEHIVDSMATSDVNVVAVLAPEHGFRGDHQAGSGDKRNEPYTDNRTGLPVYSVYGLEGAELSDLLKRTTANTIVYDIADVGVRFYTFIWSMWDVMRASHDANVTKFVVLDRPNPLGGVAVQGPVLDYPAFSSFIGRLPIPLRHGMTTGELARLFHGVYLSPVARLALNFTVVPMQGWRRSMSWPETGLPWVMPSPNMPTFETALVYPGTGLLEGTNISEGRGTTRPFELIGAPWLDWRFAKQLQSSLGRTGVGTAREVYFTPTFSKYAGTTKPCAGAQLILNFTALATSRHVCGCGGSRNGAATGSDVGAGVSGADDGDRYDNNNRNQGHQHYRREKSYQQFGVSVHSGIIKKNSNNNNNKGINTDISLADPLRAGLEAIAAAMALAPKEEGGFGFLDKGQNFDLHMGTNRTRLLLQQGTPVQSIVAEWAQELAQFERDRMPFLLYK